MAKEKEYGMTFRPKFRSLQIVHGKDGNDGISPTIEAVPIENGHRLIITDKNKKTNVDVMNGAEGYTPEKGKDYFTEADKKELVSDVINTLPKWNGGAY